MKTLHQLEMSLAHLDQLVALATASAGYEICGLMGGTFRRGIAVVRTIYPVDNVATDPTTTYRLDEEQQIRALYAIAKGGDVLVGIFHSHPQGPDRPSGSDMALNAYPEVVHCILFPEGAATQPLPENFHLYGRMVLGAWQLTHLPRPVKVKIA